MEFLFSLQGWLRDVVSGEFARYAADRNILIAAAILPAGIFFGAIHALTPGHSKAVLASYVLGSRLSVLGSLGVSWALALVHVLSAVVLALVTATIVTRTLGAAGRAPSLEMLSRGILGLIGVWLLWRAFCHRPHVHKEGILVGAVAGLIPCPLTLFAMFLALSRGIPEAGIIFAAAMMIGVAITLSIVAALTAFIRESTLRFMSSHEVSINRSLRVLDAITGIALLVVGVRQLVMVF